ncbi:MAG: RNA degradosome polyphosphate kinase, partial [Acetobacteraceae bacterium]
MTELRGAVRDEAVAGSECPPIGPQEPGRFINRELSWLAFNTRVLEEADNPRHPLLERVRFVSISATNLDEFYSVRVAGLVGQASAGLSVVSQDGLTPGQQLGAIHTRAQELMAEQQRVWRALRGLLRDQGLAVIDPAELGTEDRPWL